VVNTPQRPTTNGHYFLSRKRNLGAALKETPYAIFIVAHGLEVKRIPEAASAPGLFCRNPLAALPAMATP
jgi:hypothetical protein